VGNWHTTLGIIALSLALYNFILAIAFFATYPETQLYVIFGFLGSIAWIISSLINFINKNTT
jgi:hypothetical protein